MFQRTDNPERDYDEYCNESEKWMDKLPECECCGEKICQEDAVCIDGKWYCDDCLEFLRETVHAFCDRQ